MKKIYVLFLFSITFLNGQNIKSELNKFDSLNGAQSKDAKKVLVQLQNSKIYKHDSIKALVFNSYIRYHLSTESDITKVNKYCDSCVQFALKSKKLSIVSSCYHNQAVAYHYKNEIDTAIIIERKALDYAKQAKDDKNYYVALIAIARRYYYQAKYKESNDLIIENIDKIEDKETKAVAFLILASNYRSLGSKIKLDKYYLDAISNFRKISNQRLLGSAILEYCNYLIDNNKYNEVDKYSDSLLFYSKTHYAKTTAMYLKSRAFFGLKSYDKSLDYINQAIKLDTDVYNAYHLLDDYKVRGKIFLELNKLDEAIADFEKSKKLFSEAKDETLFVEVLKYNILAKLRKKDEPLSKEFDLFVKLKDSIYDAQTTESLTKFETQYRTAEKETKIKTQQLQLQKEKTNRNLAISGLFFVLLLGGGAWFFYRNRQKQKERELQFELDNLNNDINEMELQTLNQQLDPHEITNFIQSVSKNIMRQDEKLYNQLINLWDITNIVLNHKEITANINNEIENLEKYLKYQQEIVYPKFEFNITNKLNNQNFKIPRLLLKNLAGNAIKHGLKGIEGKIELEVFENENNVHIHVQDNGKGFELDKLGKGIGTSTYENIFTKLNLKNKEKATIEINNLEKGVLVKVCIPKNYNFQN